MAKKKIYDIVPPKVAHKVENTVRSMGGASHTKKRSEPKKSSRQTKVAHVKKSRTSPLGWMIAVVLAIVAVVMIYEYITLPKADVQIRPATQEVTLQEKITIDAAAKMVDVAAKIIPARVVTEEKELTETYPATGSASNEGKATGTIRIYNKISPSSPMPLKVGTHFLSDSGKYFVTIDKITVPAMQGKTPGSVLARVEAEDSGESHNIGPSKFSVPKLSGTAYYYTIWAESTEDMKGGYTGKLKKVTNSDIALAKDAVSKKALAEVESSLRENLSEDEILLEAAIVKSVIETSASVKADTVADSFEEKAKVKATALVFKKKDLEELVKSHIGDQVVDGKQILDTSLEVNYGADSVNVQGGTANVAVQAKAKTYERIDMLNLIEKISQKSEGQIKDIIMEEQSDVSEVKVDFWPFWVKKAPSNKNRIHIDLNF